MRHKLKKIIFFVLWGEAITGTAYAQSSVTVFGIADAVMQRGTGSISSRTRLTSGGINSSRLGFRGVEDLGGGLKASFWLESAYSADDGLGAPTNTNNQANGGTPANLVGGQGITFNRRSTVALSSTVWGELRLGRDYAPHYWNLVNSDPFGNLGSGSSVPYQSGLNLLGVTAVRVSNGISYLSPISGGFSFQYTHYRGENASNVVNDDDGNGNSVRLLYKAEPLTVAFAYGKTDYLAGSARPMNVYAEYDFSIVRLTALASRDKLGSLTGKGYLLGGIVPVGSGELKLSYSQYETSATSSPKARKVALGYVHHLSKRTAIYMTFGRINNSGGSALAQNTATSSPNRSSNGYDLGVRHLF